MRKSTLYLSLAVLLLGGAVAVLWQRNGYLKEERNRYRSNTEALLSDIKRIRVDSTTMAVDVNALLRGVHGNATNLSRSCQPLRNSGIRI